MVVSSAAAAAAADNRKDERCLEELCGMGIKAKRTNE